MKGRVLRVLPLLVMAISVIVICLLVTRPASTFIETNLAGQAPTILAAIATVMGVVIAITAALYAKMQVDLSREAAVKALYREQLRLTFDNPGLESWEAYTAAKAKRSAAADIDLKYKWFISHLLFSLEEILFVKPDDRIWRAVAKTQIGRHREYFLIPEVFERVRRHYSPQVLALVEEVRA